MYCALAVVVQSLILNRFEELRKLQVEKKALQPPEQKEDKPAAKDTKEKSATPSADGVAESFGPANSEMEVEDGNTDPMETDEESPRGPSLRGGIDRILERKRRQEAERQRREELAKQPKGTKQYQRILKKIEDKRAEIAQLEEDIATLDNDLREADCARTRCLGKDRFCNRYWWFERNGMPYQGLPDSSTAGAGYANGRLWVQGPDDMERDGLLELPDDLKKLYIKQHKISPADRRKAEEGATSLLNANHWGYYDDPESLDALIEWLDQRGERESKLKKELQLQRDNIAKYMKKRAEYLAEAAERAESEEPPAKRMTTRTKTYVVDGERHRCLRWRNSTALRKNNHLHVDPPRPTKRARRTHDESKDSRPSGRQTKGATRQNAR